MRSIENESPKIVAVDQPNYIPCGNSTHRLICEVKMTNTRMISAFLGLIVGVVVVIKEYIECTR